jgi:hypothetical protein
MSYRYLRDVSVNRETYRRNTTENSASKNRKTYRIEGPCPLPYLCAYRNRVRGIESLSPVKRLGLSRSRFLNRDSTNRDEIKERDQKIDHGPPSYIFYKKFPKFWAKT